MTMQRIPGPELMNDVEQAQAYAAADFAEPHQRFVELLCERFPSADPASALELGCGAGDTSIRFARAFLQSIVHGIDGAEAMLACGRDAVRASGLADRVELVRGYLPDDAPPLAAFRRAGIVAGRGRQRPPPDRLGGDAVSSAGLLPAATLGGTARS